MITRTLLVALLGTLALAGCRGGTSEEAPILSPPKVVEYFLLPVTNMNDQPKGKSQSESSFWADGRTMRVPPANTIARDSLKADPARYRGLTADGKPVEQYPIELTAQLVQRGQERFDIFCAPCHDAAGTGKGLVPTRGWVPPPSIHEERIRQMVPGELFHIISDGVRTMPSYASQIAEDDRWAIVSYIQALQRAHHASLSDVPPESRNNLR